MGPKPNIIKAQIFLPHSLYLNLLIGLTLLIDLLINLTVILIIFPQKMKDVLLCWYILTPFFLSTLIH